MVATSSSHAPAAPAGARDTTIVGLTATIGVMVCTTTAAATYIVTNATREDAVATAIVCAIVDHCRGGESRPKQLRLL